MTDRPIIFSPAMTRALLAGRKTQTRRLATSPLAHWHRAHGDAITFTRAAERDMLEGDYDRVYGSTIFRFSAAKVARFRAAWPAAIVGGIGVNGGATVEELIGEAVYEHYDYSGYPDRAPSIGFTQPAGGVQLEMLA